MEIYKTWCLLGTWFTQYNSHSVFIQNVILLLLILSKTYLACFFIQANGRILKPILAHLTIKMLIAEILEEKLRISFLNIVDNILRFSEKKSNVMVAQ